jgi:predicted nuclease of predicted toxin-antitoxin system
VTFLIDENLSSRLARLLEPTFENCIHVKDVGLLNSSDALVWTHAQRVGLALLSKDDDFREIVERRGPPPKLVWLRMGNVSTAALAAELLLRASDVKAFLQDHSMAILEIGGN